MSLKHGHVNPQVWSNSWSMEQRLVDRGEKQKYSISMISWLVKNRIRIRGEVIIPMTQRVLHHVSSCSPQDHHSIPLWGDFSWLRVTAKSVKIETSGISRSSNATAIRTKMRMYATSTKESTKCPRAVPELESSTRECETPYYVGLFFWDDLLNWMLFLTRFHGKICHEVPHGENSASSTNKMVVECWRFRGRSWLSVFNPNMSPPSNNCPFPSVHTYENTLLFWKAK